MKRTMITISVAVATMLTLLSTEAKADPLKEERYIGTPNRDANGKLVRRTDVLAAFKRIHPCPSTGLTTGACPGWQMNHVIPLACGGLDGVSNLAWIPTVSKTCDHDWCTDRHERNIYGANPPFAGTEACVNKIVIIKDPVN